MENSFPALSVLLRRSILDLRPETLRYSEFLYHPWRFHTGEILKNDFITGKLIKKIYSRSWWTQNHLPLIFLLNLQLASFRGQANRVESSHFPWNQQRSNRSTRSEVVPRRARRDLDFEQVFVVQLSMVKSLRWTGLPSWKYKLIKWSCSNWTV